MTMHPVLRIIIFCVICISLLYIGRCIISSSRTHHPTICCVAGKSGGHIIPCLTLAERYPDKSSDTHLLFFSSNYPLDYALLASNRQVSFHIPLNFKISTPGIYSYVIRAWHFLKATCVSAYHLYHHAPSVVITTGGLVAAPVCIAAWILGIPIELYNLDAVPGKAALWIAPLARTVHVCFTQTEQKFSKYNCVLSEYPVRFDEHELTLSRTDAHQQLGLNPQKKTVLIIGGSQGSLQINAAIKNVISDHDLDNLQIIHQTGAIDDTDWQNFYHTQDISALTFAYRDNLAVCYAAADLIISRAGAGSLFEIAAFAKPSIIIPLEADTTDHQVDNAYAFEAQYPSLCTVIRQKEVEENSEKLYRLIKHKLTLG